MHADEAAAAGATDAHAIIADANMIALDLQPGERRIMADGSAYSPSWRTLTNGERVWQAEGDELADAYVDALDSELDNWSSPNGGYLHWEDGCLFLEIAGYDE